MPRLTNSAPKYRKHRASGQAIVTLDGRDFYLGPHGTRASRREYDRLVAEWMQNGRQLPLESACDLTVSEVCASYWRFAQSYYRKNGQPTREVGIVAESIRFVRHLYGNTNAVNFGPLALKTVRSRMVDYGWCRNHTNKNVQRVVRMFRWAAAEELIPASVPQALSMVTGLRKGRTEARESKPVMPVGESVVEETLPHLQPIVGDMVQLQRLTGCRPAEVCIVRPCDVDTSWRVVVSEPHVLGRWRLDAPSVTA